MKPCDVLVLDGDENQAVACVRDLSAAGFHVAVGDSVALPKAALSRFAGRRLRYRSPRRDSAGFVADLAGAVGTVVSPGAVLLPMTEATTLAVSLNRDTLVGLGYRVVLPDHADLLTAFDKHLSGQLAESCGLVTPQQVFVADESALERAALLEHPVVIKAVSSNISSARGLLVSPRPRYSLDRTETERAARQLLKVGSQAIVQEFISGVGEGFFALYRHGLLEQTFAHRRLRDVHPTGSGSSYRESIAMTPDLLAAGTALLNALRWHGAAMVEFKRRPDGRYVFIEVNGRLWNSLPLAVASGATFPRWLAQLAREAPLIPSAPYRVGVRARWILGDLRHVIAVARGKPAGFPGHFPRLPETLRAMLRGLGSDHYDNLQFNDPLPELGDWLSAARKTLRAKAERA
jgi:predicted ATP-grasp superfamily ATP-dependent carboligase